MSTKHLIPQPSKASPPNEGWTPEIVVSLLNAGCPNKTVKELITSVSFSDYESSSASDLGLKEKYGLEALPLSPEVTPLLLGTPSYPAALSYVSSAPAVLFLRGNPEALALGVAVVGTRAPSSIAKKTVPPAVYAARLFGVPVHSGLALGVDAMAHREALDRGVLTTAVLATHPTFPSPGENIALANEILANNGAIVSEQLPSVTSRHPSALVARNRIIAGLSAVIIPAEAGLRSGTMGTVASAFELNRPVVVPVPSSHDADLPGAKGLLALAGLGDLGAAGLRLNEAKMDELRARPYAATALASTQTELVNLVRLAYGFSPAFI